MRINYYNFRSFFAAESVKQISLGKCFEIVFGCFRVSQFTDKSIYMNGTKTNMSAVKL